MDGVATIVDGDAVVTIAVEVATVVVDCKNCDHISPLKSSKPNHAYHLCVFS